MRYLLTFFTILFWLVSFKAYSQAPDTPSELIATSLGTNEINLTWIDNANNELIYKIERSEGDNLSYGQIDIIGSNSTSYNDTGLTPGAHYFYRIRATNADGDSDYSNVADTYTITEAPVAIAATNIGITGFIANWEVVIGADDYRLDVSDNDFASNLLEYDGLTVTGTSQLVEGLNSNTEYKYRVRAVNNGGASSNSNEIVVNTNADPPDGPTGLTATTINTNQIGLAWIDNADNETSFEIERSEGDNLSYGQIDIIGSNSTSYNDTGLTPGTRYFYRVRATNADGDSDYSNVADTYTITEAPVAIAATNVDITSFTANWEAVVGADDYRLDVSDNNFASNLAGYDGLTILGTTQLVEGLNSNTEYKYRVKAVNEGGTSSYSNTIEVTTFFNPPVAPTNLVAEIISQTRIDLTWLDNSTNEENFVVEVSIAGGPFTVIATTVAGVTAYSHTGLTANTKYNYRVKAANNGGDSGYSNEVEVTTLPNLPGRPSLLNLTVISQTEIDLNWSDNSDNESGFIIERSGGNNTSFNQVAEVGSDVRNYRDDELFAATLYYYRIRAFNRAGSSDPSNESSDTTWPNPPASPTNLTAISNSLTSITITWSDNSTNEEDFVLERSLHNNTDFEPLTTLNANVTSFEHVGLIPNTIYFYRVRARNMGGVSNFSNEDNATTFPTPPVASQATGITNSNFVANWGTINNAISYLLDVSTDGFASFIPGFEAAEVFSTSITVPSLTPNSTYQYRVRTVNAGGTSNYSNTIELTTLPNPAGAPTAQQATSVSQTAFTANWEEVDGAATYDLEVATDDDFSMIVRTIEGILGASQNIISLTAGTVYYYRVRAINPGGASPNSNIIEVTTLPNPTGPPVAGQGQSITQTSFLANWQEVVRADSYELDVSTDAAFVNVLAGFDSVSTDEIEFDVTGLTPATEYFYRVRTVNTGGKSVNSNTISVLTMPEAPEPPSGLVVNPRSQSELEISWQDNSDNEDRFNIEQSIGNDLNFAELTTVVENITNYTVTELSTNTQYFYRVKAVNIGGESDYSVAASATTFPNPPLAPSALVLVEALQTEAEISWTDNAGNESNFRVLRRQVEAEDFDTVAVLDENATSFRDTGLNSLSNYIYKVSAQNISGESDFTNELDLTTLQFAPTLDSIASLIVPPDSDPIEISLSGITSGEGEVQELTITANTDNEVLVSHLSIEYTSPQAIANLIVQISPDVTGVADINVRVEDNGPSEGANINFIERSFQLTVTDLPDLVVQNASASPIILNAGDELNVSSQVKNIGNGPSISAIIRYYLSLDQQLELSSDLLLGSSTVSGLVAEAVFPINTQLEIPATALPDKYNIIFFVDADGIVDEIDEENNAITSVPIEIISINAPRITTTNFPDFLVEGMPEIQMGITAEDDIGLSTVEFHYKGISDTDWAVRDLTLDGNNIEVIVPATDFDDIGIEYFFRVFNLSGISTNSETGYTLLKTSADGAIIPNLIFGNTQLDYNIFSVPLKLTNNNISTVFEDDLGNYDKNRWRLFHYENNDITEYKNGLNAIEPGKGYWLISANEVIIDTGEGTSVNANDSQPYRIDLNQGWNQIGNPYNHTISWEDVLSFNGNTDAIGALRLFEAGAFSDGDRLFPFQGAFVFSTQDLILEIPVSKNKSINDTGRKGDHWTKNELDEPNWQVKFELLSDGKVLKLGGIGMHEKASVGKDRYDRMTMPRFSFLQIAEFNFSHPEFLHPWFSEDIIPTTDQYIWQCTINSSSDGPAILRWDNTYFGKNDRTIVLYDINQNRLIDLRKAQSYPLMVDAKTELIFHFGYSNEIENSIMPKRISVGRAYPNPFTNGIKIPLTLSENIGTYFNVSFIIYHMIGVKVYEHNQRLTPGFHTLQWNLFNANNPLKEGIYIYKIDVSTDTVSEVFMDRVIHIK